MPSYGYREHRDPSKMLKILQHKKLSILIGIVFLAVLLITFSNKGLIRRIMLEMELRNTQERVQGLNREIHNLKYVRDQLKYDKASIEHMAREAHGMVKPGEVVYRIIPAQPLIQK